MATLSPHVYFAQGNNSFFTTTYALLNASDVNTLVRLTYLRPDGMTVAQEVWVAPGRRLTVATPGTPPAGAFGCHVEVLSGSPIVAERAMSGGPDQVVGFVRVGSLATATTWRFTEGYAATTTPSVDTVIQLASPDTVPALGT